MHSHHEEAIANLVQRFECDGEVVALILAGSVARGAEREDSDIDAMVVVTDEKLAALAREGRLSETIREGCAYEGGYFDLKYCTIDYLQKAAAVGSEPSRNAFRGARCLYTKMPEVPFFVAQIPVFQTNEKAEKMLSFYSAFALNARYLWRVAQGERYLQHRAAGDMVLFGLRMVLQESEVLFPCQRRLMQTVAALDKDTVSLLEAANRFLTEMNDAAKESFEAALFALLEYQAPERFSVVLSAFVADNELWWYKQRPVIAEW